MRKQLQTTILFLIASLCANAQISQSRLDSLLSAYVAIHKFNGSALETIGNSMYAALENKPYRIPQPKKEIPLEESKLQQYVGSYDVNANYKVRITADAGKLFMRINNDSKVKLSAESERKFFITDSDMLLEFIATDNKVIQVKINDGLSTKVGDKIG